MRLRSQTLKFCAGDDAGTHLIREIKKIYEEDGGKSERKPQKMSAEKQPEKIMAKREYGSEGSSFMLVNESSVEISGLWSWLFRSV